MAISVGCCSVITCLYLLSPNSNMGGQAPPEGWKGGLNISYNIGPGFIETFNTT